MATEAQYKAFRFNVGDTSTPPAFTDEVIDDIFLNIETNYPGVSLLRLETLTTLKGLEALLAGSVTLVNYKQNQASESLSDIMGNLLDLYTLWAGKDKDLADSEGGPAVAWGALGGGRPKHRRPTRYWRDVSRFKTWSR
jgi:hypothetical protein